MADQTSTAPPEIVRKGVDALNRHDTEAFASVYSTDAVVYDPQHPEAMRGREAIQKDAREFLQAFPDLEGKVVSAIHEGDRVAFEVVLQGTHKGELEMPTGSIAPTDRRVEIPMSIFARMNAQKIVEEHRYYDLAGILQQLGET